MNWPTGLGLESPPNITKKEPNSFPACHPRESTNTQHFKHLHAKTHQSYGHPIAITHIKMRFNGPSQAVNLGNDSRGQMFVGQLGTFLRGDLLEHRDGWAGRVL